MKTLLLTTIVALLATSIITTAFAQVPVPTFETAYFKGNNGMHQIQYHLINATLKASLLDIPAKELFFEINTTSNGQLTVALPRTIMDSKNGVQDMPYFVSIDDIRSLGGPMRITPQELREKDQRIVQINFPSHITEIGIAGTWFVENNSTNPPHWNPFGSWSPLQQYDKGIVAEDVKCKLGFQLIIKAEDGSPACVLPDTAQKLIERLWAKEIVTTNNISLSQNSNSSRILTDPIAGLENYTGIINWKNHTYYFETPNYTKTANGYPAQILFHNVLFTLFPSEPGGSVLGDCEGIHYMTDTKFSDGTREILHVFVDSSCGYEDIPIKLSAHTNPQAGLTVYDGKMKLLVNIENK